MHVLFVVFLNSLLISTILQSCMWFRTYKAKFLKKSYEITWNLVRLSSIFTKYDEYNMHINLNFNSHLINQFLRQKKTL